MPRRLRLSVAGVPQHIVQRGHNRQACFTSNADRAAYVHWLREASNRYGVAVHAWVLMSNHVHLLITPSEVEASSRMMQSIGRQYVSYFNRTNQRSGTLWEGRFRSSLVQNETYFLQCQRYIELNPVRARLVEAPGDYHWSSFQSNAWGLASTLLTPHPVYLALGSTAKSRQRNYRHLFEGRQPDHLVHEIRASLKSGLILGSDRFLKQMARVTGHPTKLRKRGPAPRTNL